MEEYYYCVNTFQNEEPVQLEGHIEAESKEDAIQKLIDGGIVYYRGYEFLTLYPVSIKRMNMTNKQKIIENISTKALANYLVTYNDDWGGMYYTSDGTGFCFKNDAIDHEIEWLESESET